MTEESKARIAAAREMLAWLEANDIEAAGLYSILTIYPSSLQEMIAQTRGFGFLEKRAISPNIFTLRKKFGNNGVFVDWDIARDKVCERVVERKILPAEPEIIVPAKPEREVEEVSWKCPPSLLAGTEVAL